jgi:hypothetical protein
MCFFDLTGQLLDSLVCVSELIKKYINRGSRHFRQSIQLLPQPINVLRTLCDY